MRSALLGVFIIFSASSAVAETAGVFVGATADDDVGKALVVEVKNSIRSNPAFHLEYLESASLYKIMIVTIDPDSKYSNSGTQTVYSTTLLANSGEYFDYYLTSLVGHCGSEVVESCAQKMVRSLSIQHEELVEAYVAAGGFD